MVVLHLGAQLGLCLLELFAERLAWSWFRSHYNNHTEAVSFLCLCLYPFDLPSVPWLIGLFCFQVCVFGQSLPLAELDV